MDQVSAEIKVLPLVPGLDSKTKVLQNLLQSLNRDLKCHELGQ